MRIWVRPQLLYISGSIGVSGNVIVKFEGNSRKGYCGVQRTGLFIIAGLSSGVWTITPESPDYTFTPASMTISLAGDSLGGILFTATPI